MSNNLGNNGLVRPSGARERMHRGPGVSFAWGELHPRLLAYAPSGRSNRFKRSSVPGRCQAYIATRDLSTLNLSVMSAAIISCSCSSFVLVLVLETGNELSITSTGRSTNGRPDCLPTKTKLTEHQGSERYNKMFIPSAIP